MGLRRLLVSGFMVGFVIAGAVGASAHSISDYPSNGWQYTILNRVFYTAPNNWNSSFNRGTDAGMARWTGLAGSNLSQQRNGTAPSNSWACGTAYDFITRESIPSGALASTTVCMPVNSTVRIRISTGVSWHTGSSTPNPSGTYDFEGFVTHELGHAHQAWMFCTSGSGEPCPGGHYDTTHNFPLCDTSTPAQLHTMCRSVSSANSWRWRSLEAHDRDLVEAAY